MTLEQPALNRYPAKCPRSPRIGRTGRSAGKFFGFSSGKTCKESHVCSYFGARAKLATGSLG